MFVNKASAGVRPTFHTGKNCSKYPNRLYTSQPKHSRKYTRMCKNDESELVQYIK